MSQLREFTGWKDLTLADLLFAYRKAKAEAFYNRLPGMAVSFAEYESNLFENLNKLLKMLNDNNGFSESSDRAQECAENPKKDKTSDSLFGDIILFPKGIKSKICNSDNEYDNDNKQEIHDDNSCIIISDNDQLEHNLKKTFTFQPSFRITSIFPVETHIISALWVNMIGHKLDAKLDESVYGARVRRLRDEDNSLSGKRRYHITATGIFAPYWDHYSRWRDDGLKAIRRALKSKSVVIACNFDIKSYYHNIDPNFLLDDKFLNDKIGINFSDKEKEFNKSLVNFIVDWHEYACECISLLSSRDGGSEAWIDKVPLGLPIGFPATPVLANVLLAPWDKYVQKTLTPEFYGRYVDDMFLVMRGSSEIHSAAEAWELLHSRLGEVLDTEEKDSHKGKPLSEQAWRIQLNEIPALKGAEEKEEKEKEKEEAKEGDWYKGTNLLLQRAKCRIFLLQGEAGEDLLNVIEQEIVELSSEFRLMSLAEELNRSKAARVLVTTGDGVERVDRLGRVSTATVRRYGWALMLRKVETIERALPPAEWRKDRYDFYAFSRHHVLRADRFLDFFSYLPRLLGLAVRLGDTKAL